VGGKAKGWNSLSLLFEPLGLCMYTSAETAATSAAATMIFLENMVLSFLVCQQTVSVGWVGGAEEDVAAMRGACMTLVTMWFRHLI
jgi:hypothetical protein